MTLIHAAPAQKPVIDLEGPHGNAFALLGLAATTAKRLGIDDKAITEEMTAGGTYRHLVKVFDKHFGDYFDIVVPEGWE